MWLNYCAILKKVPNGMVITFPDVPGCFTCAFDRGEVDSLAKEILSLTFHGHNREDLPEATPENEVDIDEGEEVVLVSVEMGEEDGVLKSLIPSELI